MTIKIFVQGSKPKVILDVLACVRMMYRNLDMVCGGQGICFQRRWQIFFEAFESAGIELVLVCDGPRPKSKHETWVKRQYDANQKFVNPLFDCLVIIYFFAGPKYSGCPNPDV